MLADMLRAGPSPKWFPPRTARSGVRVRLFCLPHAGSGAAVFYRWRRLLPPAIEAVPVLFPGRETRLAEPPPARVDDVVEALTDAAQGEFHLPYAFFGHSMGALLAYKWARRIHAVGLPSPTCLILSGKEAAHVSSRHRRLHQLPDEELVEQLRQRYGTPGPSLADPELRAVLLPTLRSDLRLVESYRHGPEARLDCPLVVLAGADDRSVSKAGLAAWAELTDGPVSSARLPGDHFYHVHPDHGRALIETIAATLMGEAAIGVPSARTEEARTASPDQS